MVHDTRIERRFKKNMNKKLISFGVLGLVAVVLVSAAVLSYYSQVTQTVTIDPSILVNGDQPFTEINEYDIDNGWEQKETTKAYIITNDGNRDLNVEVLSSYDEVGITVTHDTIGLSTRWSSEVDAFADASLDGGVITLIAQKYENGGYWTSSEARITIDASDVGIVDLNDLVNMSWDVDVNSGYIAHVDVIVDKNGDGIADDALVFEAAKVDPSNCELVNPYPTGGQNTLGRGIVQDSASAWLSSGAAGPGCVAVDTFYINTLSGWKIGYQDISGTTKVLRFEIEVDPWIADSESEISNIVINDISKELSTYTNPIITIGKDTGREVFYVNSVFDKMIESGEYSIVTTVN